MPDASFKGSAPRLLPGLAPAYEALAAMGAPPEGLSVSETRAWLHERIDETFTRRFACRPPVASEVDHLVPVDGATIRARVYRPALSGRLPCYLYLHGGGFWLGTLDQGDSACRGIATDVGCVVVNLDYRLAPEHRFPTALEDCYATLLWIVEHSDELGVDCSRLAAGGGSAGANLAAAMALLIRERSGPALVLQVLEIGAFDLRGKADVGALYLSDVGDADDPHASPLLASDVGGLPAALVMTAEHDQLRPEGEAYAQRLRESGVEVEERCWEGQFHGSMQLAELIPNEAATYHGQVVAALRRAFDA